jgi:hypothetical protein
MVQSDTLSRRPDYGTDEQIKEGDKVVLPDNLFINLLDTELQEQIGHCEDVPQSQNGRTPRRAGNLQWN